ncbi:MAG: hypothetical protein QXJ51_03685 [Sulfolobales archaeon]
MKIEEVIYEKGYARVVIESEDDLWVLSMLIEEGDLVGMRTTRDVSIDGSSKRRIPMNLVIRVKGLEFQPFSGRLRIRGVIEEGPEEYGLKGSHHTFSVDIGSRVEFMKKDGYIDRSFFDKLIESISRGRRALLLAIDYDSYCIALLQGQGLRILVEGVLPSPSKRSEKGYEDFENSLLRIAEEVRSYVESQDPVSIVIGSPGDLAERLISILGRSLKQRIYRDHISIGGCEGVEELIRRGVARDILREYSEVRGEEILEEYLALLAREPDRTVSGLEKVHKASELGALEKIVLIDHLLKSDNETRRIISSIISNTFSRRGEIVIIPSETSLGSKIRSIGGIIGILRFPIHISEDLNS